MFFDKKFDLIFSLGEDCACSSYLRRFNLQEYSYPFDWLTKADFFMRVNLLLNNFQGFLNKENLIKLDKNAFQGEKDEKNDYYWCKKTNFNFYHDFDNKMPFDEAFLCVKDKYQRRIQRLYKQIKSAKNILIVWWSRDKHQDIDKVIKSCEMLSQKFNSQNLYMLLIENAAQEQSAFAKCKWGGGVMFFQYDNTSFQHNPNYNEVMGNEANNAAVFCLIQKNKNYKHHIKAITFSTVKFFINLIPIKSTRHTLRKKWRFHCFKDRL